MQINLAEMPLVGMLGGAHWAGPGACHRGCHISHHVFIPLLFVLHEAICSVDLLDVGGEAGERGEGFYLISALFIQLPCLFLLSTVVFHVPPGQLWVMVSSLCVYHSSSWSVRNLGVTDMESVRGSISSRMLPL